MRVRVRRLLRIALSAIGVAVLGWLLISIPSGEPRYGGKPLHYWLPRVHNVGFPASEAEEAEVALACIGTNNLPLLLKWFRESEPSDSEPAYKRVINRMLSHQHFSQFRLEPKFRWSRPAMAFLLFSRCPEVAERAIPQFAEMLADNQDVTKAKASIVLGKVGKPAIPALVATLSHTNDITRALAAFSLGEVGTNVSELVPTLRALLKDKALCVRLDAAIALGRLGDSPEQFVPVIVRCAHEGDADARFYALDSLGKLKDRAKSAVPDLTNTLATVTNVDYHLALLSALREIDPGAAARFDPPRPVAANEAEQEASSGPSESASSVDDGRASTPRPN